MIVDKMTTNYCKVISLLDEKKVVYNKKYLVPILQKDVAKILGITTVTVNSIFKELKEDKLIFKEAKQYYLTEKAVKLAKKIKELQRVE